MSPVADDERRQLLDAVERGLDGALELARWMAAHPEVALGERNTRDRYCAWLEARGFQIETGVAGLETAFVARCGAGPQGAALLAEMDALPEIGHACGHNLSGPASLLAAAALVEVLPADALRVVVVGCPAEEIGAGKPRLVEAGVFDEVDIALMAHAAGMRRAHRLFLGNRKLELLFHGHAAHAAAYPERGRNALDAVVALFVSIGLLRQQLPGGVRVHGVIHQGGTAPNVIPERAGARVWVRSLDDAELSDATERVLACARGAAESTGCRLEVREEAGTSPPLLPNQTLARLYGRQLEALGLPESGPGADRAIGSSDITHVSRVVPTIHPNFPIGDGVELHTRAFAEAAASPAGERGLHEAARALALTVRDWTRDAEARAAVEREFRERRAQAAAEGPPGGAS